MDQIGTNAMIYNPKSTVFWKQGELMLKASTQAFEAPPPLGQGYRAPVAPLASPPAAPSDDWHPTGGGAPAPVPGGSAQKKVRCDREEGLGKYVVDRPKLLRYRRIRWCTAAPRRGTHGTAREVAPCSRLVYTPVQCTFRVFGSAACSNTAYF